jgi:hypothetical protein
MAVLTWRRTRSSTAAACRGAARASAAVRWLSTSRGIDRWATRRRSLRRAPPCVAGWVPTQSEARRSTMIVTARPTTCSSSSASRRFGIASVTEVRAFLPARGGPQGAAAGATTCGGRVPSVNGDTLSAKVRLSPGLPSRPHAFFPSSMGWALAKHQDFERRLATAWLCGFQEPRWRRATRKTSFGA